MGDEIMMKRFIAAATVSLAMAAGGAAADTINFESDTTGGKANGFQSVDSALVSFTDTLGADLEVFDFGDQSNGQALATDGDDESQLQLDFSQTVNNLIMGFGNDDPGFTDPGDTAVLQGFLNGIQVGEVSVTLNRDDLFNQTITLGALIIDQAFFFYADDNLDPIDLIEIVDDISFDAAAVVPLPATLPLLLGAIGLGGLALRRRARRA